MLPLWLALFLFPILGGAERFNCRGRILGAYYADAKSGCKAFHVCVRVAGGGIRDFRFFCPPGTLFHQEAQTCTDWGDDDPLACPAEIYDGQFDLYKIGSGFDTKKMSSPGNRDEESEYGLQRAETGDRRSSQNNGASDLRAAHSSDFFSGQRDRGRDDAPTPQRGPQNQPSQQQPPQHHAHNNQQPQQSPQNQPPQHQPQQKQQQSAQQYVSHAPRQSFRRPTTRAPVPSQYSNPPPTPPPQPSVSQQYENSKRKLVRKRPIYVSQSTPAAQTTFAQNTQPSQSFPEQAPQQQQQQQQQPQHQQLQQQQQHQQQQQQQQQNYNRRVPQNRQTIPPVNVPPQFNDYKDEYVEVSRVTPKPNKYFQSKSPAPFSQSTPVPNYNKNNKDGLVELYNYDAQSTPGLGSQNNQPFKVRNGFSVSETSREPDYLRSNNINANRGTPTTVDYNNQPSRATTSTSAYKNFNSVSYEPEKNNFVPYSKQQNYYSSTTTPATTAYTTTFRPEPPLNLNTVAYNTNIGFGNTQESNYAESDEDDGQYRPPQGEDDGQYRPELYERELLSGAHSLNIAASGNRLPEDQKPRGKTKAPFKTTPQNLQTTFKASQAPFKQVSQTPNKPVSQTAAPRPFRPAPTPTSTPAQRALETYSTTLRPQTQPQTQRTFDYYQTYTTTSRPSESSAAPFNLDSGNNFSSRPTTTLAPRAPEPRQPSRAPAPSTAQTQPPAPPAPLRPTTRPPFFANPASNKEDNSYDYAYYDSDPGFSEYDHIEEFGKTKTKKA